MCLQSPDEVRSVCEALVSASVQPRESLPQKFNVEFSEFEVYAIQVSDFEFTAL